MNFQKKVTKRISFLLIITILSLNLSFLTVPKKADAIWGVGDVGVTFDPANLGQMIWEYGKKLVETAVNNLAKTAARVLIQEITDKTVAWIRGGFNGNPAYVADFNKFLTGEGGVLDQTVGSFFQNNKDLSFLCDPFRVQVSLALQANYTADIRDRIGCTLSQITQNISNAANTINVDINGNSISNFTASGGWNSFLIANLNPQNNPQGAYLIAQAELDAQIQSTTQGKTLEITAGGGSLSFKRCYDTYYLMSVGSASSMKKLRVLSTSTEYTEGQKPPAMPAQYAGGPVTSEQHCEVKSPGSTITAMLGFKANQDQESNNLVASLSNGIDAIFVALGQALLNRAASQLTNGVLDKNTVVDGAYLSTLASAYKAQTNSDMSQLAELNGKLGSLTDAYPNALPTRPASIPDTTLVWGQYSTTTQNYFSSTTPLIPTVLDNIDYTSTGDNGTLSQARNNALTLIKSLLKSETTYQNNFKTAQTILTQSRDIFASSSACNISYNRTDSVLRALIIRANVVTNIEGSQNSDRTLALIPWNLEVIKSALEKSTQNINLLNKASSDVSNAGSIGDITNAMIPVNSNSFDTDPQAKMIDNIKTWLSGVNGIGGVGNIYNSKLCPIDLTNVLKIGVATSTPVKK